jgi:hypothetical protein
MDDMPVDSNVRQRVFCADAIVQQYVISEEAIKFCLALEATNCGQLLVTVTPLSSV